ncbi:MAG: ATP-binding protein [Akkermansia sp.]
MTDNELRQKLHSLIDIWENEIVEFKGKAPSSKHGIADYVSALSNEAFLKGKREAWLILGVDNATRTVCGTGYKQGAGELNIFMQTLSQQVQGLTHVTKFELTCESKRVLMFRIPAAIPGSPVPSGNIYYGRNGESLIVLPLEVVDRIRFKSGHYDWSGELCEEVSIEDLDPEALNAARTLYTKDRHDDTSFIREVNTWSTDTFLTNLGLMERGHLNHAALLLLGKNYVRARMRMNGIELRWILRQEDDTLEYLHLTPPFILAVDTVYKKIRNPKLQHMNSSNIFPDTMLRYDEFTLREAINNAVAHCDYTRNASIDIVEVDNERVVITNRGSFLPKTLECVLDSDSPFSVYRNDVLANAMLTLKMIDRVGSGIRRMFRNQLDRLYPVPEYRLDEDSVQVVIMGKTVDISFAEKLKLNKYDNITLWDISLLYSVYQRKPITKEAAARLRGKKLIIGRFPNVQLAPKLMDGSTPDIKQYFIDNQDLSDELYKQLILNILKDSTGKTRSGVMEMLNRHFPRHLSEKQRKRKVVLMLQKLRDEGKIRMEGKNKGARWSLVTPSV